MTRWGWPSRSDLLLAAAVVVLAALEITLNTRIAPRAAALPLELGMAAAVAWRRSRPLFATAIVALLGLLLAAAGVPLQEPLIPLLTSVVVAYSLVSYAARAVAVVGTFLLLASVAGQTALEHKGVANFTFAAVFLAAMWLMGLTVRRRTDQAVRAQLAADRARLDADAQVREAAAAERERIARELHDVVAQSLGVMVVQAAAAEELLRHDPGQAQQPVRAVQSVGRDALAEMARLLGVLRGGDADIGLTPQPGIGDLPALAERSRTTGLDVTLHVGDAVGSLSPGVGLAVYRTVQEALTNTRKHAGCVHADIRVDREGDDIVVEVVDTGHAQPPGPGTGHGLAGLRERVHLYGGTLHTGPAETGGFVVHALIPAQPSA